MSSADYFPATKVLFTPLHFIDQFRENRLVIRSDDPRSFPEHLKGDGLERIEYLQLTDFEADPSPLVKWESVFPIDLVMMAPGREFPRLYSFARLLDRGPVRVSIPMADGIEKAVKLAASLRFSVKIIPGQPKTDQVMQLIRLADYYLKNPIIEEPIEFFHSLFFAIVKNEVTNLWEILEKDPDHYCFVSDEGRIADGEPVPLPDLGIATETGDETTSVSKGTCHLHEQGGTNRHKECAECIYYRWCRGFFKYPAPDYSCAAIFPLFEHLFAAATEFKQDMSASSPETTS